MKALSKPEKETKLKPANDFVYRDIEDKIKKIMGTKVVIKNKNNNKGKIEIDYYSQEELERIYDMLKRLEK
jgi:ParB family chromosome partitioning protein